VIIGQYSDELESYRTREREDYSMKFINDVSDAEEDVNNVSAVRTRIIKCLS
jgi:hypothetical protein